MRCGVASEVEARYQWRKALAFETEEDRAKIDGNCCRFGRTRKRKNQAYSRGGRLFNFMLRLSAPAQKINLSKVFVGSAMMVITFWKALLFLPILATNCFCKNLTRMPFSEGPFAVPQDDNLCASQGAGNALVRFCMPIELQKSAHRRRLGGGLLMRRRVRGLVLFPVDESGDRWRNRSGLMCRFVLSRAGHDAGIGMILTSGRFAAWILSGQSAQALATAMCLLHYPSD